MLHCQDPATMSVSQDYPNSIEDQLLGYWSQAAVAPPQSRSSNICTPGVTVNYNGQWYSDGSGHHCTNAKAHSLVYDSSVTTVKGGNSTNTTWPGANIWQYAMAKVIDSTSMTFWVRNRPDTAWDSVMGVTRIHLGNAPSTTNLGTATPLTKGYISIQMEGTTTEFAKIELLNLSGCMTPTDANYKTYFVRNDTAACGKPAGIPSVANNSPQPKISIFANRIEAASPILGIEIRNLQGVLIRRMEGNGARSVEMSALRPGVYSLHVKVAEGSARIGYVKM
jgi:hypothetical protein